MLILQCWHLWWLLTSQRWEKYVKPCGIQEQRVTKWLPVKSHLAPLSVQALRRLRLWYDSAAAHQWSLLDSFKYPLTGCDQRPQVKLITDIFSISGDIRDSLKKTSNGSNNLYSQLEFKLVKGFSLICGQCGIHLMRLIRMINTSLFPSSPISWQQRERLSSWVNIWKSFDVLAFSSAMALWLTGLYVAPFLWLFSIHTVVEALELPLF